MADRWQQYMPIDDLQPAPRNPKRHDIPGITSSMGRLGYIEPIALDERTQRLISGHGRVETLAALHSEGREPPEGVTVVDGVWQVPVSRGWASADDEEAAAAVIALNRHTETGGWDAASLAEMLDDLSQGRGLDGVGYTTANLEDLLAMVAGPPDLDALADELGEPDESDFWPVLRFKVPPGVYNRFRALVAEVGGGDHDQFEWMLVRAEAMRAHEGMHPVDAA